jgi:hypothetical protein
MASNAMTHEVGGIGSIGFFAAVTALRTDSIYPQPMLVAPPSNAQCQQGHTDSRSKGSLGFDDPGFSVRFGVFVGSERRRGARPIPTNMIERKVSIRRNRRERERISYSHHWCDRRDAANNDTRFDRDRKIPQSHHHHHGRQRPGWNREQAKHNTRTRPITFCWQKEALLVALPIACVFLAR